MPLKKEEAHLLRLMREAGVPWLFRQFGIAGVPAPAESAVERVARGCFGVSFISENLVFKVFYRRADGRGMPADMQERYFSESLAAYHNLSEARGEITARGIEVPQLLNHGVFSRPIVHDHRSYYGWQLLTRVPGQHPRIYMWERRRAPRVLSRLLVRDMARLASALHVPSSAEEKKSGAKLVLGNFRFPIDGATRRFVEAIDTDIESFLEKGRSEKGRVSLLHGDLHQFNVLQTNRACTGVIDWDQQTYGRPEQDIWKTFYDAPDIMATTRAYNRMAARPADPRLVVAYCLVAALGHYHFNIRHNRRWRYSVIGRQRYGKDARKEICQFAQTLYRLTGKAVYAEMEKLYANPSYNPVGASCTRPVRRRMAAPSQENAQK